MCEEVAKTLLVEEDRKVMLQPDGLERSYNLRVLELRGCENWVAPTVIGVGSWLMWLLRARQDFLEVVARKVCSITAEERDAPGFLVIEPCATLLNRPDNCGVEDCERRG